MTAIADERPPVLLVPVGGLLAEALKTADTINDELALHEKLQAEALALVADNPWCQKALARRGLVDA